MLSKALDLLDQHLYGKLNPVAGAEAINTITQAHNQLSFRKKPVTYYQGQQLKGIVDPDGQVGFKRIYPELGIESYASPEELINRVKQGEYGDYIQTDRFGSAWNEDETADIKRLNILEKYNQEKPTRELIQIGRAFQDYSSSSDGNRLYYNTPVSDHRAKAYKKQGFENIPRQGYTRYQMLDNRPYADDPIVNKFYAVGDAIHFPDNSIAEKLLTQRSRRLNLPFDNNLISAYDAIPLALPF